MKKTWKLLLLTGISLLTTLPMSVADETQKKPNIIVILSDDQGYADISLSPNHPAEVKTPHMDALAKEGVSFTQGYTSGHVCSPTRAGLMTGNYQQRVGIYTAGQGGKGFNPHLTIFPGFLPEDYRSMAIGKWHLGLDDDYPALKWHAMNRGFDECYKFMGRGGHDYFKAPPNKDHKKDNPIYQNKDWVQDYNGYLTTRLTEEAVQFIDRNKEQPFFLYLAYNAVHSPSQAPEEDVQYYQNKYPKITKERAIYLAMLKHLDDGVGAVTKKLKQENMFNDTLIFFLTDNGGSKSMQANNGILKGFKQNLSEGGIRTPYIVSWPNKFKGGRQINTPVISFDILPTALDAAGLNQGLSKFDGKSLLPLLTEKTQEHHETLFWHSGQDKDEWAIRQGDWKLHYLKGDLALYELPKDPSEKQNLAKKFPERVEALKTLHEQWHQEMKRSEQKNAFVGK